MNFDDAFYSRIHLTLPFKALDKEAREGIWKTFLHGADVSTADLAGFASRDLNGRQIKNVMKMARLLAKHGGDKVSSSHIRDVLAVLEDSSQMSLGKC